MPQVSTGMKGVPVERTETTRNTRVVGWDLSYSGVGNRGVLEEEGPTGVGTVYLRPSSPSGQ